MSHVPPHKWAMRVDDRERAKMLAHAEACPACARARDRVTAATASFGAIKAQPAPEVAWDSVRARIHWSVSTARRAKAPSPRRISPWWALGAAAVAAGVVAIAVHGGGAQPPPVAATASPPPVRVETPRPALPAAPIGGLVSRASGDVTIDGAHPAELFNATLAAGSLLATGDGKVDVQFGEASAFALGPKSSLELRHFDAKLIELAIDGTVDIEVAARTAGQRFLVHAGDTTVEVRGTQFRVSHTPTGTTVACRHGLVAVSDPTGQVEVGAARRVAISAGAVVRDQAVAAMSRDELASLAAATPLALPLWSDALAATSAPLEIATAGHREARVDGVELGAAPMRVRVMLGRHTVETADASGRFRRAGWVDVAANRAARVDVPAEARPTGGIAERRQQLLAGLDRTQLGHCTRAIAKQGLSNTFVQVEIAVDATGAVGFLNVIDTDLPSATAACVREVLAAVPFGVGPAATWREKLDL